MTEEFDKTCIKNDVCDMAICDGLECNHRYNLDKAKAEAREEFAERVKKQVLKDMNDMFTLYTYKEWTEDRFKTRQTFKELVLSGIDELLRGDK